MRLGSARASSEFHWLVWYDSHGLTHYVARSYLLCGKSCQINTTKPNLAYFTLSLNAYEPLKTKFLNMSANADIIDLIRN